MVPADLKNNQQKLISQWQENMPAFLDLYVAPEIQAFPEALNFLKRVLVVDPRFRPSAHALLSSDPYLADAIGQAAAGP